MSDEVVIRVDNVSKDFVLPHDRHNSIKSTFTSLAKHPSKRGVDTQHALRDISFEIKRGEFFGIVGRNGSGKSTLLKILANIYQPTAGKIYTSGKLVPFIELGVGFNGELTGRENVYLNGAMLGFSRGEIDAMYDEIVEFAEIGRFMDQKLKNYSSGMQVRLAFSMATRAKADILLVDEVLAVGDADFQRKCFDHFRKLKRQKKTVVFVSHDMDAIREYCDRAVLIDDSRIVNAGDTEKVAMAYTRTFTEQAVKATQETGGRWGNGKIVYEQVKLNSSHVTTSTDILRLTCVARATEDMSDPIFGFNIKNATGNSLLGTNSRIKKQHVGEINKGQKVTIEWEVPNIFADGIHYVEPAIVQNDAITVCDWWEAATTFNVTKEERTPYITNPDIGLSIKSRT